MKILLVGGSKSGKAALRSGFASGLPLVHP